MYIYICIIYVYILPMFQNVTQIIKDRLLFWQILNGEEWDHRAVKKLSTSLRGISSKSESIA